ncbi:MULTISPECIES: hypothetical protein [unclassified Methylophaga]|jgi:hypothetical protein|uniref:hypothetical protein n=1 Tax=unclassified Methylophaga TaxID=2629249 RepID=UPI000C0F9138|nr:MULTISPECIES: hypothetical protein [unclassified Methylophaga]MAM29581.1 hypothetical protein [Flavobacteriaceae bacterium]MBC2724533.1 hypothetical protein [Desulfosporosinus sp.]MAL50890.1 hypothetical protein [Methylophaga sp.]MBL1456431.1 hypothetical protein [Methylophaga sp.]MBN45420.1 hypothetical protein [Methylophaga sp.]|tara:strand:+ start:8244 stop:8483 length:240 start_codon:yes stop_codon:yes gene_type:complete
MGKSAELAYANLVTYIDTAELLQQSDYVKEEYVLCRGGEAYIGPPIYCDLTTNDRTTYFGVNADPLDVKRLSLEEAEFF